MSRKRMSRKIIRSRKRGEKRREKRLVRCLSLKILKFRLKKLLLKKFMIQNLCPNTSSSSDETTFQSS